MNLSSALRNKISSECMDDKKMPWWCSGLAYGPVTAMTWVRIPARAPFNLNGKWAYGPIAQAGRATGF